MKHLRVAVAAAIAASTSIVLFSTASATTTNTNDAAYWQAQTEHPSQCYKHDPPTEQTAHGALTDDGKAVVLNEFDQNWPGDHWELLVVKSGSVDNGDGPGNTVYEHPVAGQAYFGPLNGGGEQGAVSHWIVCKGTSPELAETSVSWTTTDGTCASTDGTLAVGFDGDAVTYVGDPAGTYPNGTSVTGSFAAQPGYVITGDAGPFSHTFSLTDEPCESPADLRLNLTAECAVGDILYWRVTNDQDVDIPFTWDGPGANDGAGVATAGSRTYFTTVDAGGANTTTIDWENPAGEPDSKTKAHNNESCVYHVSFEKAWTGGDAPDLDGATLLTAESSLGTATCTSDDGALSCVYSTGDDLHVPFGETYSVDENVPDGWIVASGTGSGFTGINGFDDTALPDALVYDVAADRTCVSDPNADFPFNLEKFCDHTVTNELADVVVVPAAPTFVDPTCAAPTVQVDGVDGTTSVSYEVTGTVAPGETVTVTATAKAGYELDPEAPSVWEHTFGALADDACVLDANPVALIEAECGSALLTFSNKFDEIPAGYTAETADFTYTVDGVQQQISVAPNGSIEVPVEFKEDSGDHTVQLGDDPVVDIESNCEPDKVTATAPTFVDPTCDDSTAGLELPKVAGVSYQTEGTATPGATVKVTASANEGYVLVGVTKWTHDYTALEDLSCEPPQIEPPTTPPTTKPTTPPPTVDTTPPTTVDTIPIPTVGIGQAGPTVPTSQLPKTGSDATSSMVTMGALLLLAGAVLIGATRRRATNLR